MRLENDAISVNGNDILAFGRTVCYKIRLMRRIAEELSCGLFNAHLKGSGSIVITTHYVAIT